MTQPKNAEQHVASNFYIEREVPSLLIPGKTYKVEVGYSCPRCGTIIAAEHGEMSACPHCALGYVRYGNSLYLWETRSAVKTLVSSTRRLLTGEIEAAGE